MRNRIKVLLLASILLIATIGTMKISSANVFADEMITVRFHYTRDDSAYDNWTMWVWNNNDASGKGYDFTVSGSEAIAEYSCPVGTEKVGFIVKGKKNWDKDVKDDRFVEVKNMTAGSVVDIFVKTGTSEFTSEVASNTTAPTVADTTVAETTAEARTQEEATTASDVSVAAVDGEAADETEETSTTVKETTTSSKDNSVSTQSIIVVDVIALLVIGLGSFLILGKKKIIE